MRQNFAVFLEFLRILFIRDRSVIRTMVLRDLKAQYVGSIFGLLWAVIEPIAQLGIYGVVFGLFLQSKVEPVYGTESFLIYLLAGLVPWEFFSHSVNSSTSVIIASSNLVKRAVGFPSEILPIVKMLTSSIAHLIGIGLLMLIVAIFARPTSYMLFFVLYMFFIALFSIGVGWTLSAVNVYVKDVQKVMGIVMMGWFFFTPIFYSPAIVPSRFLFILKLNPMYHAVMGYRYALLAGRLLPLGDLIYLAVISCFTFAIGGLIFRKLKPGFAEEL